MIQNDFTMFLFFLTGLSFLITILMVILRLTQRHNKELIGTMRNSYEKQIYLMNDKLTASMDRWQDVNHLVIGSQTSQLEVQSSQHVRLSAFLESNGVQQNDIKPETDLVFVLIPFNNRYNQIFKVIQQTCQSVGLRCLRGDEEFIRGDIIPHILKTMCKASIIIANIDGRNANVFYELGLAHAMDKATLLVSKNVEDIPIDIQSKKIIVYKHLEGLNSLLKDELLRLAYIRKKTVANNEHPKVHQKTNQNQYIEDIIRGAISCSKFRLFFNPNDAGHTKNKVMHFGLNGEILEGKNKNESSWKIFNNFLELIDSKDNVHSRFLYDPKQRRFSQENDPESGSMRKHGIQNQYMIPE